MGNESLLGLNASVWQSTGLIARLIQLKMETPVEICKNIHIDR
jgi:hypothetical protein